MQLLCSFSSFNFCNFLVASMHGNVEVAKILIANGADLNKKDKIKKSSLMVRLYIKFVTNAQNVISHQVLESLENIFYSSTLRYIMQIINSQCVCTDLYSGRVLLGLFRNRNTRNRRYLCSFGSYSVFGMNKFILLSGAE